MAHGSSYQNKVFSTQISLELLVLQESFDRVAATRGKKRAIVAIARRLIGRIRACFREGTLYTYCIFRCNFRGGMYLRVR